MLPNYFIFIAAAMRLLGGTSYLRAVIKGQAEPYPLSWLLWGITPMIAFAAELQAGVGLPALITFALGLSPLMVFTATMIKKPKLFYIDVPNALCCVVAILGIILWQTTGTPYLAIIFAISADIFSAIPTIRKILRQPFGEYLPAYIVSSASMVIALLAISDFSFEATAFPFYVLFINTFLAVIIARTRKKKPRSKRSRRVTKNRRRR